MDNSLEKIVKIHRPQLKKYALRKLHISHPGSISKMTTKLIGQALIFIEGYTSAVSEEIMPPYNEKDIQELLLEVGYKYIMKNVLK
jgi:hypothetical protein